MRMWTPPTQRRRSCGWRPSRRRCWLTLRRRGSGAGHRSRIPSWQIQVGVHDLIVLMRTCSRGPPDLSRQACRHHNATQDIR